MHTPQPIQFLLHQLATNEGDRVRFNQLNYDVQVYKISSSIAPIVFNFGDGESSMFGLLLNHEKEKIIRTCLSQIRHESMLQENEAILSVFPSNLIFWIHKSFAEPIYDGKPLDIAIQALHDKMLELVPEYREFINNEK